MKSRFGAWLAPLMLLSLSATPPLRAQETEVAMEEPDLSFARAIEGLNVQTAFHDQTWRAGNSQWAVDLELGVITFTNPDGWVITAPVQVVGTYSTKDGTWLWGWDHPSVPEPARVASHKVRAFGEQYGLDVLTTRMVELTEDEAWELTALANYLWQGQGAYRGPAGTTLVFMTFGEITITKP
jgi:hypothetical protein